MKKILANLAAVFLLAGLVSAESLKGSHVTLETDGSLATGSVNLITKNAGPINFYTNSNRCMYFDASTCALVDVAGGGFSGAPVLDATGSDSIKFKNDGAQYAEFGGSSFDVRMYPPSGSGQFSHTLEGYGIEPNYPVYYGRRARGTFSSPTAAQLGDHGLVLGTRFYGATGFPTGSNAALFFTAIENQTDAAQGAEAVLELTPTGAAASTRGVFSRMQRTSATQHKLLFGPTSTATDVFIGTQTVNAADTGTMTISAADACSTDGSRGACAIFGGDDDGSYPGQWNLIAGTTVVSHINMRFNNASGALRIKNAADAETVSITGAGYVNVGGGKLEIPNGTTIPATCTQGEVFHDTDSNDCANTGGGDGAICSCKTTNTWALITNI